jgi:dipeptidyl aminopeptidase/acylaminoacyl peptidase
LYASDNVVRNLSWAPDGRSIAFEESGNIFILDVESRQARTRIDAPGTARHPRFSPDGRLLTYSSDESGRDQVYVVPAFGGSARVQVSSRGGFAPEWGPRGDELFFVGSEDAITVARVSLGSEGEFGVPETLFPFTGASQSSYQLPGTSYRIGPNGTIFIRAQVESGDSQSLTLILNWPELVK